MRLSEHQTSPRSGLRGVRPLVSLYAPIVALAVSLHGPASLRVLSHLTM